MLSDASRIESKPMNILAIDGNEVDRKLLAHWLSGYAADFASTLEEAAEQAASKQYDVVICDVDMPAVSSLRPVDILKFCRRIQGARLVAVSGGHLDDGDVHKTEDAIRNAVERTERSHTESLMIEIMSDIDSVHQRLSGPN